MKIKMVDIVDGRLLMEGAVNPAVKLLDEMGEDRALSVAEVSTQ